MILEILLLSGVVAGLTKKLEKSEKWNQIAKDFVGEFDEESPKEMKKTEEKPFNPANYKFLPESDYTKIPCCTNNNDDKWYLNKWHLDNLLQENRNADATKEYFKRYSENLIEENRKAEEAKKWKYNFENNSYGLTNYLNSPAENFKPYVPMHYYPPIKSDDKIIEDKIDRLRMVQAGEHKQKMERMHAEGRVMMSNHWAKMDRHMNRGFR